MEQTRFIPQTVTPPAAPLPLLKAIGVIMRNPLEYWPENIYRDPYMVTRRYGRTYVQIADPELMKTVLLDEVDAFPKSTLFNRFLKPAMGDSLLTTDGPQWRFQRRTASPAFRFEKLKNLAPIMAEAGEKAASSLAEHVAAAPVNVMPVMVDATFDVISGALLTGYDGDVQYDQAEIADDITHYIEQIGRFDLLSLLGAPDWLRRPWKTRGRAALRRLHATAVRLIAEHRDGLAEADNLLSLLIAARDPETGKGLSDRELRDNLMTFVGAGHETTALALTWTLYVLANMPDIQDRLVEEEANICAGAPVEADHIDQLTFHAQVVQEAMRLYPPVAAIGRTVAEDVQLGDLSLRPKDHVVCATYPMHRHHDLWQNPALFDPDRFALPAIKSRHKYAYLPFGAGPHICIGMRFALMEAVVILASIIRRVKFLPNPSHEIVPQLNITLRPKGGMPLHVVPR